jgi:hypothetical protein
MKWNEMILIFQKWEMILIFQQSFANEIDEISWNFMRFHEDKKGPQMKCNPWSNPFSHFVTKKKARLPAAS